MVIPGHTLGNSQVSVNRTIGPTLVTWTRQIRLASKSREFIIEHLLVIASYMDMADQASR